MFHIKLSERLASASPSDKRRTITSDETWAFTEHPKIEKTSSTNVRIEAHDLFNLFTASIIKEKTSFIR